MRLLFLAVAGAATLTGGAAATLAISDHSLALAGSTTGATPAVAPARTTEDASGPCDEAEHANEARCAATTTTSTTKATRREDRAGHRHRGRHGRSGESRSASGPGSSATDHRGRGSDDNSGRGGDDNSGHGGGGHGRDHPEDD
ncbi:MAG: hypothetical protein ACXWZZ_06455 [Solirubrobacteraceae bacterium]